MKVISVYLWSWLAMQEISQHSIAEEALCLNKSSLFEAKPEQNRNIMRLKTGTKPEKNLNKTKQTRHEHLIHYKNVTTR